jgi:hypothetical protein
MGTVTECHSQAIDCPGHDDIEPAALRIVERLIKPGPILAALGTTHSVVRIGRDNVPAAGRCNGRKGLDLICDGLPVRRHAGVKRRTARLLNHCLHASCIARDERAVAQSGLRRHVDAVEQHARFLRIGGNDHCRQSNLFGRENRRANFRNGGLIYHLCSIKKLKPMNTIIERMNAHTMPLQSRSMSLIRFPAERTGFHWWPKRISPN